MNCGAHEADGLRRQQQAFLAALLGGEPGALLRPLPGGRPAPLDVYRSAYTARLAEALGDNHEVLRRALGDEAFDALAQAYLAAHPSGQPSIRWFGHRLAEFMDGCVARDDGLVPHPALADLARLDWALRAAFDAADAPVLARAALAAVPAAQWPALHLRLHPGVALLALAWAVAPAWHALRAAPDGEEPELPAPEPLAHTLLVWRREAGPDADPDTLPGTLWRTLDDTETRLLQAVVQGLPLADLFGLAEEAGAAGEQAVARVTAAIAQWFADGLVSAID